MVGRCFSHYPNEEEEEEEKAHQQPIMATVPNQRHAKDQWIASIWMKILFVVHDDDANFSCLCGCLSHFFPAAQKNLYNSPLEMESVD